MAAADNGIPKKYQPHAIEEHWLAQWGGEKLYAWDPDPSIPREQTFAVDTPPPTVSGSLHVGHMFSYSHQDFIVRFQRMRGKNIFFPIGWDDNGLPTERRVQNAFNVKCEPHLPYDPDFKAERGRKGDPQPISRLNFIELCEELTAEDEQAFKHLWTRLGMSYDWSLEYATIDEHCRRTSQLSFLDMLEKDEVYQAEEPVMWDVDFQTAIAQAEVADKERPSAYHFLNFAIEGSDEQIVIATTRPELLAACGAVLVHPEDDRYQHLVGKNAITPLFHAPVPIMADEKADPEKGTGIVMVCTFGDQTDIEWWRQFKLPLRQIIGRDGHLLPVTFGDAPYISNDPAKANEVYGQIQGKYVKQAQKIIAQIAEETPGVIAKPSEDISHAVRFFEKGDRPLEYVPTRQWYARIMEKKDALIEQGKKIAWHPEFMGTRYSIWVEGLNQDWCLSRQRYFGVPIPVWYKLDAQGEPLHSERLLPRPERLPIDPLEDCPEGYTEDQRDQPNGFTGDPDVFDTWATSSLTPQICTRWAEDKARHARLFPMDLRPQSHEIIRTWAFYTITKAYMHERVAPWHNVVISGWILDPDRKKMSKSHGNVVTPEPLIDEFGADAVRYWAARARLGVDTAYDEQVFKVGKKLCTKLFNASKFCISRFADIEPERLGPEAVTTEVDRAVIAELRPVLERAAKAFEQFDYAQALSVTEDFFWRVFCDNYLEIAKPRTYEDALTPGRLSAASTLRLLHRALTRMLAPVLPFLTEEVWHWAYSGDPDMHPFVHKSPWPSSGEFAMIPAPAHADTFAVMLEAVEGIRKAKTERNLSMAAPVKRATVTAEGRQLEAFGPAADDIRRMLGVEEIAASAGAPGQGLVEVVCEFEEAPAQSE